MRLVDERCSRNFNWRWGGGVVWLFARQGLDGLFLLVSCVHAAARLGGSLFSEGLTGAEASFSVLSEEFQRPSRAPEAGAAAAAVGGALAALGEREKKPLRQKAPSSFVKNVLEKLNSLVEACNIPAKVGNAQQAQYVRLSHLLKRASSLLPTDPTVARTGLPLPPLQRAPLWLPLQQWASIAAAPPCGEHGTARATNEHSTDEKSSETQEAPPLAGREGGPLLLPPPKEKSLFGGGEAKGGDCVVKGHQLIVAKLVALHFLHQGQFDLYETFW